MTLGKSRPDWRIRDDLTVERVTTPDRMDIFSEAQSRGFNETPESYERWHPWLKAANHRNLGNGNQIFYVGFLDHEPVGTVLTVFDGETAGIYAVATLPRHRKKGVSTTIMRQAIQDAEARGAKIVTLQVRQDSDVEDFYRNLGFQRNFVTGLYRRDS